MDSGYQLVEFLANVSALSDDCDPAQTTVEHAAEELCAEVAALTRGNSVLASIGFPNGHVPVADLCGIARGTVETLAVPGAGDACAVASAQLDDGRDTCLVIARAGAAFDRSELTFLRAIARVHALTSETRERQRLLARLSRIQRSISHGADLDDLLASIMQGADELLPSAWVGLRLLNPDTGQLDLVAENGIPERSVLRQPLAVGEGAGGRAFSEAQLVVLDSYRDDGIEAWVDAGVTTAMAAPVWDDGELAGSLTIASTGAGSRYSAAEQEILLAFAEHASLALTDGRRIDEGRAKIAHQAEERFRALVQGSMDVIMVIDSHGPIRYATPSSGTTLGYSPSDLVGHPWLDLVHESERPAVAARVVQASRSARVAVDCRLRHADGRWVDAEILVRDLTADPNVRGIVLTIRDISERRRSQEELRQQERYLQGILDNTPAAVYLKDTDGRFLLVNRAYERLLGIDRREVVGSFDVDVMPPDLAASSRRQDLEVLTRKGVRQWSETFESADGPCDYFTVKFPLFGADGNPYAVCMIATDVTEQRGLERQLQQAQRLESVGQLAGGVAHDFNNLLAVIQGHSELLAQDLEAGSESLEDAQAISAAAGRAAALTQQLLVFAKHGAVTNEVVDLNSLVEKAERLLHRTIGAHIRLETHLEPELDSVFASPVQIEQVLVNLVVNARDAMPDGGTVRITTKAVEDGRVELIVTDDGCGMESSVAQRAFEPFFSTKPAGEGSGLGLATVYGIVSQAGGDVRLDTKPGQGTRVTVFLPAVGESVSPNLGQPDKGASARGGGEVVLLVEDEHQVRAVTARALIRAGYEVLEAEHPEQALDMFDHHRDRVDLLLSDVVMPGMSGRELADTLRRHKRQLPVLLMSGYAPDASGAEESGFRLLAKPVTSSRLLDEVATALRAA